MRRIETRRTPIDTPDTQANTQIIRAHADAGERHGARFHKKGWRAAPRLSTMLERLECLAGCEQRVSVEKMLNAVGRSSFAPLLLVPGLIVLSPVGGMPGIPTTVAVMVGIAALQILRGRCYFWLPRWLLARHVSAGFLKRAIRFMRPLANLSERWCRPRMRWMTGDIGSRGIAALCLGICIAMPPLEIVPMANSACGGALALFGLALTTRDGLLTGLALALCVSAAAAIAISVF